MSHLCAILQTGYIGPRNFTHMAIFCDVTEFKKPMSCQALSKARLKGASSTSSVRVNNTDVWHS